MKQNTSFLKRFFALFLALLMAVSGTNLGVALQVSATGTDSVTVSVGKLVADNYELTAEEEALLSSGHLSGGTITYTVPTDGAEYVTVDTENKTIAAENAGAWVATVAYIVVNGEKVETVTLTDGTGTYTYAENAFSVVVDYTLDQAVAAELQETLLNTAAWLKQGVANLEAVSDQKGNLYILQQAMPALVEFANGGIKTDFTTVNLSAAVKEAVFALNDQMAANGGVFDLDLLIKAYDAASQTQYLLNNSQELQAELADFVGKIAQISQALNTIADNLEWVISQGFVDAETAGNLETLADVTTNLNNALAAVNDDPWTAAEMGTALVSETVDYAVLDELVAALGDTTAMPEIKENLHVAGTSLQVNMSMFNVTVTVRLQVVEDVADSNELVEAGVQTVTLTLAEGATIDEILAAIEANGIVASAKAAWGENYVAEHFVENPGELPETLTEDIEFVIEFIPKEYHVMTSWGDELDVYYGYQMTLPVHSDPAKAYDYTIGGEKYAQGAVYTVVGNTSIERATGKAYKPSDLYTIVSNNYGNDLAKRILQSGALLGNVAVNVREPDPNNAEELLQLLDGVITAETYDAAYMGLSWVPSTYGANGTENSFSGNSAAWDGKAVKVQYVLNLTNFPVSQVAEILDMAEELKKQADAQTATLDRLAVYYDTMGQLDEIKLGALNGVIDVTDFTPGDGTKDDAANLEMRAYFKGLVSSIIDNSLDSNGYLKIYNILEQYLDENGGLQYYYINNEAIINEINTLSEYLTGLLADDEKVAALEIMVAAAGYPEYAEKIMNLESVMAEVKAALTPPHANIDLESPNLYKLVEALEDDGEVVCQEAGTAYLTSPILTATDESQVIVQVVVVLGAESRTITTAPIDRGEALTAAEVEALKEELAKIVAELMGDNAPYYEVEIEGTPIDELVGVELDQKLSITYTYTAREYTVKIDGEADQVVTVDSLQINLPAHPDAGWVYRYTIGEKTGINSGSYKFTTAELGALFVDGVCVITREAINEGAEKLEAAFKDWAIYDDNGNIIALNAVVAADKDGIMGFVDVMLKAGYTYIGLNGEGLLYMNEGGSLEISLQTLINAILNDNSFGSQTLIALGTNGHGQLVTAEMQLGNSAEDCITVPFTLTLSSVPAQMATVAQGLNAIKNYMSFNSDNGVLDITLTLPEKVYEVYLTALLATGEVEKDDITAVNDEIAFMFLYDYLDIITETEATTASYTNTLAKLGVTRDLTGYEGYYQMLKKALSYDGLVVNSVEGDEIFDINMTAEGQKAINALINLLGVDVSAYETYLGMIKEYKEGNDISVTVIPSLSNAGTPFEAVIIDVNALRNGAQELTGRAAAPRAAASTNGMADTVIGLVKGEGVANGFDYTTDLIARSASITGEAAIMLLGDVDGDLIFNGTTILDLNGYTINGNVVSNGSLYIVDSSMETIACGGITGSVSGNVKIIAGNYNVDVTAYLPEGYVQEGTSVHNVMYIIEADDAGNVTFVINTDVIDEDGFNVKYLAVDIAVDLALNYFTAAALNAEGIDIYNINIDDLIGLIDSTAKVDDLINKGLNSVNVPGIAEFANIILADLIDFAAIESAIANDEALATYTLATAPWTVAVEHETSEDYITFGITSNPDLTKEFTVSLRLDGDNKEYVEKLAGALADIVVADGTYITIELLQPTYANHTLDVSGSAEAAAEIDLTKDANYTTILAVIMAYGNPEQADALAAAVNSGNNVKLKEIIDNMTVEDVFDALKAVNRSTSFAAMAEAVGVTIDVADAAELESIYHLILCGAGKVLETLEITGRDSRLGNLDKDNDGTYEFSATTNRSGSASARGYAVAYDVTEVSVSLTVHLFGNSCIVGDVNHDRIIDIMDVIELHRILAYAGEYDIICEYCADVNQDDLIDILDVIALHKLLAAQSN